MVELIELSYVTAVRRPVSNMISGLENVNLVWCSHILYIPHCEERVWSNAERHLFCSLTICYSADSQPLYKLNVISHFPYFTQNRSLYCIISDSFSAKWQLKGMAMPGKVLISYQLDLLFASTIIFKECRSSLYFKFIPTPLLFQLPVKKNSKDYQLSRVSYRLRSQRSSISNF